MPGLEGARGANINGPSLIRAPEWLDRPRGRYYLYFAHHHGDAIRVAFADDLLGPWTVDPRGVLAVEETAACDHVASPDVHVEDGRIRMYFHGRACGDGSRQVTFLATSRDGLRFAASSSPLAPFYLRAFAHDGWIYGIAKLGNRSGVLLRAAAVGETFEPGPAVLPRMRHAAVLKRNGAAWIFYTRIGDAPESVLATRLALSGDWREWQPDEGNVVLTPERGYEGAGEPLEPSLPGIADGPRRELRDPAVYAEDGRVLLLYAVAGEQGIALAELRPLP